MGQITPVSVSSRYKKESIIMPFTPLCSPMGWHRIGYSMCLRPKQLGCIGMDSVLLAQGRVQERKFEMLQFLSNLLSSYACQSCKHVNSFFFFIYNGKRFEPTNSFMTVSTPVTLSTVCATLLDFKL